MIIQTLSDQQRPTPDTSSLEVVDGPLKRRDIFGSFLIDEMEFAVSVKVIHEVINEPKDYKRMPLSPPYLLGLLKLRDMVIPVINLRQIFKEDHSDKPKIDKKIAIIEYKSFYIGVLFDRTGEVFTDDGRSRVDFGSLGGTPREQVIRGVFKLDEGKRIVMILDPFEVLKLDKVPHSEGYAFTDQNQKKLDKRNQCISFVVGESLCAININAIQESRLKGNLCRAMPLYW